MSPDCGLLWTWVQVKGQSKKPPLEYSRSSFNSFRQIISMNRFVSLGIFSQIWCIFIAKRLSLLLLGGRGEDAYIATCRPVVPRLHIQSPAGSTTRNHVYSYYFHSSIIEQFHEFAHLHLGSAFPQGRIILIALKGRNSAPSGSLQEPLICRPDAWDDAYPIASTWTCSSLRSTVTFPIYLHNLHVLFPLTSVQKQFSKTLPLVVPITFSLVNIQQKKLGVALTHFNFSSFNLSLYIPGEWTSRKRHYVLQCRTSFFLLIVM